MNIFKKHTKKKHSSNIDKEALKHWQKTSLEVRLNWLDSALRFGKSKRS